MYVRCVERAKMYIHRVIPRAKINVRRVVHRAKKLNLRRVIKEIVVVINSNRYGTKDVSVFLDIGDTENSHVRMTSTSHMQLVSFWTSCI